MRPGMVARPPVVSTPAARGASPSADRERARGRAWPDRRRSATRRIPGRGPRSRAGRAASAAAPGRSRHAPRRRRRARHHRRTGCCSSSSFELGCSTSRASTSTGNVEPVEASRAGAARRAVEAQPERVPRRGARDVQANRHLRRLDGVALATEIEGAGLELDVHPTRLARLERQGGEINRVEWRRHRQPNVAPKRERSIPLGPRDLPRADPLRGAALRRAPGGGDRRDPVPAGASAGARVRHRGDHAPDLGALPGHADHGPRLEPRHGLQGPRAGLGGDAPRPDRGPAAGRPLGPRHRGAQRPPPRRRRASRTCSAASASTRARS